MDASSNSNNNERQAGCSTPLVSCSFGSHCSVAWPFDTLDNAFTVAILVSAKDTLDADKLFVPVTPLACVGCRIDGAPLVCVGCRIDDATEEPPVLVITPHESSIGWTSLCAGDGAASALGGKGFRNIILEIKEFIFELLSYIAECIDLMGGQVQSLSLE